MASRITSRDQVLDPGGQSADLAAGIQAVAQVAVNVGKLADTLTSEQHRRGKLWQAIRPLPGIIIPQITTTNGTADYPELCSPRNGYWWDVHSVVVATFSAGTVNLYLTAGGSGGGTGGALADSNLRYAFTTKGALTFGKAQLMVPSGMRLVFSASGITGNASPAIYVTEIASWALPDYLL